LSVLRAGDVLRYLPFVVWFFVAFALIAIGTGLFLSDRAFVARSLPIVGEVRSVDKASAFVEWRDTEGRAHDHTMSASSAGTYVAGQRVQLRYDPAAMDDVRGDALPFGAIIVGCIGVAFLGFGMAVVVVGLRRDRARAHAAVI
jgi:hypothetical protein